MFRLIKTFLLLARNHYKTRKSQPRPVLSKKFSYSHLTLKKLWGRSFSDFSKITREWEKIFQRNFKKTYTMKYDNRLFIWKMPLNLEREACCNATSTYEIGLYIVYSVHSENAEFRFL